MSTNERAKVLPIIWFALFSSIIIYTVVGFVVAPEPPQNAEDLAMLPMVFGAVSLGITGIVFMARVIFASITDFIVFSILRWALSESIAVFGLVLTFLTGNTLFVLVFALWSAHLFLLTFPTRGRLEAFENRR